jgi:creatinine amidohydrolase/Fe(II)-dependent formamide hydrolase-like protein
MKHDTTPHEVAGLTWDRVRERLAGHAAAILPIGAGSKQHGLHIAEPMPFSPAGLARGPLSPDDPSAPNYAPSGSFGDPTLATPDKGSRVLTAILADMVEAAE